jgi:hypothetical protein
MSISRKRLGLAGTAGLSRVPTRTEPRHGCIRPVPPAAPSGLRSCPRRERSPMGQAGAHGAHVPGCPGCGKTGFAERVWALPHVEVPSFPERDRQAVDAPDVLLLVGSEVAPRSHRRAGGVGRPPERVMRTAKCLSVAGAATACRGAAADSPETTCRSRRALRSP